MLEATVGAELVPKFSHYFPGLFHAFLLWLPGSEVEQGSEHMGLCGPGWPEPIGTL